MVLLSLALVRAASAHLLGGSCRSPARTAVRMSTAVEVTAWPSVEVEGSEGAAACHAATPTVHSQGEAGPVSAQPLPQPLLERPTSKAADSTAFDHAGAAACHAVFAEALLLTL